MSIVYQMVTGALQKKRQGRDEDCWGKGSHFKQGKKVAIEQSPEEAKDQVMQISGGKSILGGEASKYKCPETEISSSSMSIFLIKLKH